MPILDRLQDPSELRGLSEAELDQLAAEIRETIIRTVAATGGHLGSSLGVVEITLALHRLLESPRDQIVWDTGHQAYAHKLLTGRLDRFHTLRQIDGIGGFPRRTESPHDVVRRRPRRHRACRSPRASPRRATCATRSSGSRSSSATRRCCRASSLEALNDIGHRQTPAADRAQRQRDVDQPVGRRAVEVPVRDQALAGVAAEQVRLRPGDRAHPGRRAARPRAVAPAPPVGRLVRPAGPAVRGPRDHLHRRDARARPAAARGDLPPRARAQRAR